MDAKPQASLAARGATGMTDERQLQETIARCVSILVFYRNTEQTPDSTDRMAAEIRSELREFAGMKTEVDRLVFRPIELELMARFGPEMGPRVVSEFLSICHPSPCEAERHSIAMESDMNIVCRPGKAEPDRAALAQRLGFVRVERFGGDRGLNRLASMLGMTTRTWRNYESGVSIPGEVLLNFIEISAAEPLWLLRGVGPRYRGQRAASLAKCTSTDPDVEAELTPQACAGQR